MPAPQVSEQRVDTRHGSARLTTSSARRAWATLVLGHGAGGSSQARDLNWLAVDLPAAGVEIVRVEQPWRVAGGKVAPRAAILDEGWQDAMSFVPRQGALVVGGRSAGARVACRTAKSVDAVACLALAFPLRPPWRPDRSRLTELLACGVPTLVVQGDRDAFGCASDFPPFPESYAITVVVVCEADHHFGVRKSSGRTDSLTRADLVASVLAWLRETVSVP